jgi:hypothetical protein
LIELSHDQMDKLPNVMLDVENMNSPKGAGLTDFHMIPPNSSGDGFNKPSRQESNGNRS